MTGLELDSPDALALAVECWRIEQWLARQAKEPGQAGLRYAVRKIKDVLGRYGLETVDLTGSEVTDGLAIEICDVVEDPDLARGAQVIAEMLSPIVLWQDQVVQHGRVVVRRAPDSRNL